MAPDAMKAVRYHEFGGVDRLRFEDAPRPRAHVVLGPVFGKVVLTP
jgi:hypothetical protein